LDAVNEQALEKFFADISFVLDELPMYEIHKSYMVERLVSKECHPILKGGKK
jgi:hypothetical protein